MLFIVIFPRPPFYGEFHGNRAVNQHITQQTDMDALSPCARRGFATQSSYASQGVFSPSSPAFPGSQMGKPKLQKT